jgi:hypothetical protein
MATKLLTVLHGKLPILSLLLLVHLSFEVGSRDRPDWQITVQAAHEDETNPRQ